MNKGTLAAIIAATGLAIGGGSVLYAGSTNARTSAGHEGYVYHDPFFVGKRRLMGTQTGPSSTGLVWREFATNIDMRPDTYSEKYQIVTKRDMNLTFESHARISLKPGSVQDVVERFGSEKWYKNNVMRPYRSAVREAVRKYEPFEVKNQAEKIAKDVLGLLRVRYEGTPIVFESLDIGNIDYPRDVQKEIELKEAAQHRLQRKSIDEEIAKKDAQIRITESEGLARSQEIINDTLTPLYLQHEAIQAYKMFAESGSTTFLIAPTSPDGTGMPVILQPGPSKTKKLDFCFFLSFFNFIR